MIKRQRPLLIQPRARRGAATIRLIHGVNTHTGTDGVCIVPRVMSETRNEEMMIYQIGNKWYYEYNGEILAVEYSYELAKACGDARVKEMQEKPASAPQVGEQ